MWVCVILYHSIFGYSKIDCNHNLWQFYYVDIKSVNGFKCHNYALKIVHFGIQFLDFLCGVLEGLFTEKCRI